MGSLNAIAFADAVGEGQVGLLTALSWHLTANHFPPLPGEYAAPLAEAIALASDGEYGVLVTLPEGIQPVPGRAALDEETNLWSVSAADLVEACNAWAFVAEGE